MYSSQIKRQLTDMPRYTGHQGSKLMWALSMLANRGTKPQISTFKLETSSSENVSLKNVEFVNASLVWPFWATVKTIDEARMQLFCHGNKTMEKFHQPKQLFYSIQNMQRIKLVSGPLTKQDRPSPEGLGWSWDDEILSWTPSLLYRLWTTL